MVGCPLLILPDALQFGDRVIQIINDINYYATHKWKFGTHVYLRVTNS